MISQHHLRSQVVGRRWDTGQASTGPSRTAVAFRLAVPKATKLSSKGATEDVEDLFSFQPSAQPVLKVKRSLTNPARRARAGVPLKRADIVDEDDDAEEHDPAIPNAYNEGEGGLNGSSFHTASLRDATATASTSGHTHLSASRGRAASRLPVRSLAAPDDDREDEDVGGDEDGAAAHSATVGRPRAASVVHVNGHSSVRVAAPVPSFNALASSDHDDEEEVEDRPPHPILMQQDPELAQAFPPAPKRKAGSSPPAHLLPPGLTTERDKDIYQELRGCDDWRDVLDVVADETDQLSLRTAVQALTRLNALSKGSAGARQELVAAAEFQRLTHLLHSQVPSMNNVQLSNTLYALAQLGVKLNDDLLRSYFDAARDRSDCFYPRDIATLFSAAATMKCSPPQELLDELGFRATGFLNAGSFESRTIPQLLHACALLGYKNPILAQAAAQQLAAPGVMAALAPQGVANSLWALARMSAYHSPTVEVALACFTASPASYKPQECANLLWAMTAFRHHPGPTFAVFAKCLLTRLHELRGADMATLMYALGSFNVSPGAQVLAKVEQRVRQLLAADPIVAGAAPEEGAEAEAGPSSQQAEAGGRRRYGGGGDGSGVSSRSVNLVELCNMYWGLALLGEVEAPLFEVVEARLAAEWGRAAAAMPDSLKRMIFQGFLASRLAESSDRRPTALPPLMLDACKRAWTTAVVGPENLQRRREAVDHVAVILDKLKVVYDRRRPTGDGLTLIDLALKAGPETYVALQVLEDEHHCSNDRRQLLGTTIMQRQLLEKNGWGVRYLNFGDLERLAPAVQPMFVADLLRQLGVRVRLPPRLEKPAAAAAGDAAALKSAGNTGDAAAAAAAAAAEGGRRGLLRPLRKPQAKR